MKISSYLLGALLAMTMNFDASALSITPSNPTPILTFTATSQATIDQEIKDYFVDPDPTLVYKQDVDAPSDEGAFAASYSTEFFNTPTDPAEATITYVPPGLKITDVFSEIFLLVKDGNANPSAYLFDISPPVWDGMDALVLTEFWPDQGAISHVSIYARGNGSTQVPDGGATLMLLGVAFGGLETLRRKMARKSDNTASH